MNSKGKPVQASLCQQVQTSLKYLTNFNTSDEVGKKSLTKASLLDAPIQAAKISSCRLAASLTANMESNKIMRLYLCRVEENILRVNELNQQLQEYLGNQMSARKEIEVKAYWLKERFQRETEQLKKRFDFILTMKDESNKKINEKCCELELRIIEEKQARELLVKELTEGKDELKNVCYERDKLLKACENEMSSIKMELQAVNNREGVREILIRKLEDENKDLKNVSFERDGLLKTYETEMKSVKAELEAANNKEQVRELLIKNLEKEKKELKNESNKREEQLKENEIKIESFKFELEAANNRKEARELIIKKLKEEKEESHERKDELLKAKEIQIESIKSELEAANKREEAKELLIKEIMEEKDELKKVSYEQNELLKAYELQITSIHFELEAANNSLKHERNSSALAACDFHHIEGVLKNRESDLLNAKNEIRKLTQQVRQHALASDTSKINQTSNSEAARLQKQLNHAEKEMKKYESKYRDTKVQLKEAKQLLKNIPATENASNNQRCTDCQDKIKELQVLQNLLRKRENEAREMFEHVQRLQATPVNQPADNSKNSKTELLMDLLPTVNLIHDNDLKPVIRGGKQVILGEGAFGQVSLMKYVPTNTLVAVKTIFNSAPDDIILEGRAMQLCSAHPSFPVMLGIVRNTEGTPIKLVSTFIGDHDSMKSVSLRSSISEKCIININKDSLKNILLNVSVGIAYLHKNNIVHNDIKSENIIIDYEHQQWVGKIIDLGGITSPLVEPPAAEATSSDIFALSMVMCELAETTKWQKLNELAVKCKKTRPPIDDVIRLLSVLSVC